MPFYPNSEWNFLKRLSIQDIKDTILSLLSTDYKQYNPQLPPEFLSSLDSARNRLDINKLLDQARVYRQAWIRPLGYEANLPHPPFPPNHLNDIMSTVAHTRFSDISELKNFSPLSIQDKRLEFLNYLIKNNILNEGL